MENKKIPENIDYDAINGIATEARQKLKEVRPLICCASITYFWCKSSRYFYFTCLY